MRGQGGFRRTGAAIVMVATAPDGHTPAQAVEQQPHLSIEERDPVDIAALSKPHEGLGKAAAIHVMAAKMSAAGAR